MELKKLFKNGIFVIIQFILTMFYALYINTRGIENILAISIVIAVVMFYNMVLITYRRK